MGNRESILICGVILWWCCFLNVVYGERMANGDLDLSYHNIYITQYYPDQLFDDISFNASNERKNQPKDGINISHRKTIILDPMYIDFHNRAVEYERENSKELAMKFYKKGAKGGVVESMYCLGAYFEHGYSVSIDYNMARKWYRKAAKKKHGLSAKCLGVLYQRNEDKQISLQGRPGDPKKWYEKSAVQGDKEGQYCLANWYFKKYLSPEVNERERENFRNNALVWYEKAADQNHPDSIRNLGLICLQDTDVRFKKDPRKAVMYFQKGAQLGHAASCYELGVCYDNCLGVNKDTRTAFELYKKAADLGYQSAYNNVGCCYYNGEGAVQNIFMSLGYFILDFMYNNQYALESLATILREFFPYQIGVHYLPLNVTGTLTLESLPDKDQLAQDLKQNDPHRISNFTILRKNNAHQDMPHVVIQFLSFKGSFNIDSELSADMIAFDADHVTESVATIAMKNLFSFLWKKTFIDTESNQAYNKGVIDAHFEKAYGTMITILDKFYNTLTPHNTLLTIFKTSHRLIEKCRDNIDYRTAMIAFLMACKSGVGMDEGKIRDEAPVSMQQTEMMNIESNATNKEREEKLKKLAEMTEPVLPVFEEGIAPELKKARIKEYREQLKIFRLSPNYKPKEKAYGPVPVDFAQQLKQDYDIWKHEREEAWEATRAEREATEKERYDKVWAKSLEDGKKLSQELENLEWIYDPSNDSYYAMGNLS